MLVLLIHGAEAGAYAADHSFTPAIVPILFTSGRVS